MGRQSGRWIGVPALALGILGLGSVCWERPVRAQSATGNGAASYPYGSGGARVGVGAYSYSNVGGSGSVGGSSTPSASGLSANPYAVPSMNPFLNPYAGLYAPATGTNAALYFLAAQQTMGGIGSGQLSGSRPRPSALAPPAPIQADRRVSDTPGGGAARYFNRKVRGGSVPDRHYNRYGNYYSTNGH